LAKIRCPYCQQAAMSWLHVVGLTAVALLAVFYLLRFF
jgi:hypothetical protein